MTSSGAALNVELQRNYLMNKEYLFYPLDEALYLVPKPSRSDWLESIAQADTTLVSLLFIPFYIYLEKKDKADRATYRRAYKQQDTATLSRPRKAFAIRYTDIDKLHIDARKSRVTTDWDKGKLTIRMKSGKIYVFPFYIYSQLDSIKLLIDSHLPNVEVELVE